jgi:hypothetical protein
MNDLVSRRVEGFGFEDVPSRSAQAVSGTDADNAYILTTLLDLVRPGTGSFIHQRVGDMNKNTMFLSK